jgi:Concanavalin A-like lectin/glucanases superfamily
MKKSIISLQIICLVLLFSCQTENIIEPLNENGKLELSISAEKLNKIIAKVTTEGITNVVVDIEDGTGQSIYSNKVIRLFNLNGEYISEPISIATGNYKLTKFLITDDINTVLYATPVEGSQTAYLVNNPLSIDFSINKDETKKIVPEVLNTTNYTAEDFGYATFGFNIVETFNFKIGVFIYDESILNYKLTTADVKVFNNSDQLYSGSLVDSTNSIVMKDSSATYTLLVQKSGYNGSIKQYTNAELKTYSSNPIEVILDNNNTDSYTKLLLNADGINGQSIFIDNSPFLKTILPYGDVITDTNVKKNGLASVYYDGTGDYLKTPDDDDFNFGAGDFTIDFWVNFSSLNSDQCLFSQPSSGYSPIILIYYSSTNKLQIQGSVDGTTWQFNAPTATPPFVINTWYHVALVRNGTNWRVYINGNNVIETAQTLTLFNSSEYFFIGGNGHGQLLNGYLDDFRVSKGIARWTSNFTPE